jgi:pimeloyl-ACP methyl ester carboxylesterase
MGYIRKIITVLFIVVCVSSARISGQIIDPWNGKQINPGSAQISIREGIHEGLRAKYGVYAHQSNQEQYTALPFILIPCETNENAPIVVIFNGGPGASNLTLPAGTDSLIQHFHVLLPGYRGSDDVVPNLLTKTEKTKKGHQTVFQLIASDISAILTSLKADTVYIAAHSFGSVYACEFLLMPSSLTKKAIFISPVMTQDITKVVFRMEKMVLDYFSTCLDGDEKYKKIISIIEQSPNQDQMSLGLVLYLSEYQNFKKLISTIDGKQNTATVLKEAFDTHQKSINRIDQSNKVSEYFNIADTSYIAHLGKLGTMIHAYFRPLIREGSTNRVNFDRCIPEIIISAEFDFSIPTNNITIEKTGHSDVWKNTYKHLIKMYREKKSTVDASIQLPK